MFQRFWPPGLLLQWSAPLMSKRIEPERSKTISTLGGAPRTRNDPSPQLFPDASAASLPAPSSSLVLPSSAPSPRVPPSPPLPLPPPPPPLPLSLPLPLPL